MPATDQSFTDTPIYWFVILEIALDRGNFQIAARAQRELRRLGVEVTHQRRRRGKEVSGAM